MEIRGTDVRLEGVRCHNLWVRWCDCMVITHYITPPLLRCSISLPFPALATRYPRITARPRNIQRVSSPLSCSHSVTFCHLHSALQRMLVDTLLFPDFTRPLHAPAADGYRSAAVTGLVTQAHPCGSTLPKPRLHGIESAANRTGESHEEQMLGTETNALEAA